jgi:Lrp/AsnC family transcriptional regulator for asnA, asnC and gidA
MDSTEIELDEKDWQIIALMRDGNTSNSTIAAKLGVSEGMIRQRTKRLRDLDILVVRGLINPEVLAHRHCVFLGANVSEASRLEEKAKQVSELPNVIGVSIVTGRYDVVIELLLDSHRGLVQFLTQHLPRVSGITSTESFVALKTFRKHV